MSQVIRILNKIYNNHLLDRNSIAPEVYNLSLLTSLYGSLTAAPLTGYAGSTAGLTATPDADCHFVDYEVTGGSINDSTFTYANNDATAKANFARNVHNNIVLTSDYGTITATPSTANSGDVVTLTNTPNDDCHFVNYEVTGATLTSDKYMVETEDVSARGVFARNIHNIALQTDGNGTLTATKTTGYSGDNIILTPTPNTNYTFSGYTITGATMTGDAFKVQTNDVTAKAWFNYVSPTKHARIAMRFADIAPTIASAGKTYYPFVVMQDLVVTGYTGDNIDSLLANYRVARAQYYAYPLWNNGDTSTVSADTTARTINFSLVDTVHLYTNTGATTAGAYEIRGRCNVNNEYVALQQYIFSSSQISAHQVNPRNIQDSNNLWIYGRGQGIPDDFTVAGSALYNDALYKCLIPVQVAYWYNSTAMCAPNPIVQHSDFIADITWTE